MRYQNTRRQPLRRLEETQCGSAKILEIQLEEVVRERL